MSVSKGKTVATLLDAKFTPLRREGSRRDKLISFRTIEYVQANILLFATYNVVHDSGGRAVRASADVSRLSRVSLKADHPTSDGTLHSDFRWALQEEMFQYYEEVLGWEVASGVAPARPRELKTFVAG